MSSTAAPSSASATDSPRTRPRLHKIGGAGAAVVAGTYIVGFLAMLTFLAPRGFTDALADPVASLAFLTEQPTALYVWYAVLYLLGGAALLAVVLALQERLRPAGPDAARAGAALGLIWCGLLLAGGMVALVGQRAVLDLAVTDQAAAVASWHAVSAVQDGLGGGIELVGALWLLTVCLTGLRSHVLSTGLAALGVVLGAAGLATLVPTIADDAASVFGLGSIVWFSWTAYLLLSRRGGRDAPAETAG